MDIACDLADSERTSPTVDNTLSGAILHDPNQIVGTFALLNSELTFGNK